MPSNVHNNREMCPTKDYDAMTKSEAINAIKTRTKSLERLMVHKNPVSPAESRRVGIEDENDEPQNAEYHSTDCPKSGSSQPELEMVALKHRQIISVVNKDLNNLFRYTLDARLKILRKHRQEFQVDIKTVEEYLFLLRKLQPANDKNWARKISIASEIMTESTVMRSNIEARIQEVEVFLSEVASEKVSLEKRREMMLNLGIRHGTYGDTLSLRDHDKFPQSRYGKLIDIKSLEKKVRGAKVVSKKPAL
ncbi:uncharacterized protein EAE97_005945 [Botrytis byssoidea]|uniref:Uncharacterized protein n=1 Tax=Botrytis byssoidea TaxID=139641 RepID=A0A9P5IJS4_9HELO|nr:uncharacterized protein EAE97_005945 [Botrytis byssoidea]KAF7943875.1 hypothetical protein EAE97_005945 [Botrytis byssoidea]